MADYFKNRGHHFPRKPDEYPRVVTRGTAPSPSARNRYVTEQDPRLIFLKNYIGDTPSQKLLIVDLTGKYPELIVSPDPSKAAPPRVIFGHTIVLPVGATIETSSGVDIVSAAFTSEVPSGAINGSNKVFTLSKTYGFVMLFKNSMFMRPGGKEYSLSGTTITYVDNQTPQTGQEHHVIGTISGA